MLRLQTTGVNADPLFLMARHSFEAEQLQQREGSVTVPAQSGALTGEVYGLTVADAQAIAISNQIRGGIWLTNPYEADSYPFITIPISKKLSLQLAAQRPRMM